MALERTLISSQQAAMEVFSALVTADVKSGVTLTGAIYPLNRPVNSNKEDIVVSTLAMNADQMQEGVINVNIHVPNLLLSGDTTQPNLPRFAVIADSCLSVLDSYYGVNYNFSIEGPGTIERDGNNWFCNIRVRFYAGREDII